MEKKEFRVQIPVGYQIDEENSTFKKIVFKPVADAIDYNDVVKAVGDEHLTISNDDNGVMLNITIKPNDFTRGVKNKYMRMMFRVLAYYQLLNIARYFNGDWKPDWQSNDEKYHIASKKNKFMEVPQGFIVLTTRILDYGTICFKNKEDAQAVIDNPNFWQILKDYFS